MNSVKKFIKDILYPATLIFTLIVFFFSILFETKVLELSTSSMLKLSDLILIFILSLLLSWSLRIFSIPNISYPKALLLHYAATLFGAVLLFAVFSKKGSFVVVFIIVTAIYAVCASIATVIRRIFPSEQKAALKPKNEYKRQFK